MPFVTPFGGAASCFSPDAREGGPDPSSQRGDLAGPPLPCGPEVGTELAGILKPSRPAPA